MLGILSAFSSLRQQRSRLPLPLTFALLSINHRGILAQPFS